ncbi:MAG: carbamoyl phosphate synthase large subunit, partial [Desulfobacteraceae bacterium]
MPKHGDIDKILVIGSGPVFLGQAGELDQASVQACDALRSMGYQLVIAHSDPAAVITDLPQKDHVYIEPLDINSLSCIINIENPDAILALYGGQTALNLIADLSESEIFSKNKIRLLDLSSMALNVATDRLQLKALSLPEHITHSRYTCADSTTQAISEAEKINYPLVIRSHFQEPGLGNTIAYNVEELRAAVNT